MIRILYARTPASWLRLANRLGLKRAWRFIARRKELADARRQVPVVLDRLRPLYGDQVAEWRVLNAAWTDGALALLIVGPAEGQGRLVLRTPHTILGAERLRRQHHTLAALASDRRLACFHRLVPEPILLEDIGGRLVSVESVVEGEPAATALQRRPAARSKIESSALAAIGSLHELTARPVELDTDRLARWVSAPLKTLVALGCSPVQTDRLERALMRGLLGRTLMVGWIHGDYFPGNVLVDADNSVTGVVDWDLAETDALIAHDILNYVVGAELVTSGVELGDVVLRRLRAELWRGYEESVLLSAGSREAAVDQDLASGVLLLYWLRFVSNYLAKVPGRAHDGRWISRNVHAVLEAVS